MTWLPLGASSDVPGATAVEALSAYPIYQGITIVRCDDELSLLVTINGYDAAALVYFATLRPSGTMNTASIERGDIVEPVSGAYIDYTLAVHGEAFADGDDWIVLLYGTRIAYPVVSPLRGYPLRVTMGADGNPLTVTALAATDPLNPGSEPATASAVTESMGDGRVAFVRTDGYDPTVERWTLNVGHADHTGGGTFDVTPFVEMDTFDLVRPDGAPDRHNYYEIGRDEFFRSSGTAINPASDGGTWTVDGGAWTAVSSQGKVSAAGRATLSGAHGHAIRRDATVVGAFVWGLYGGAGSGADVGYVFLAWDPATDTGYRLVWAYYGDVGSGAGRLEQLHNGVVTASVDVPIGSGVFGLWWADETKTLNYSDGTGNPYTVWDRSADTAVNADLGTWCGVGMSGTVDTGRTFDRVYLHREDAGGGYVPPTSHAVWVGGDCLMVGGQGQYSFDSTDIGFPFIISARAYLGFVVLKRTGDVWAVTDGYGIDFGNNDLRVPDAVSRGTTDRSGAFLISDSTDPVSNDDDYQGLYPIGEPFAATFDPDWPHYVTPGSTWEIHQAASYIDEWFYLDTGSGFETIYLHPVDPEWTDGGYIDGSCQHWGDDGGFVLRANATLTAYWLVHRDGLFWVDGSYRELVQAWGTPMGDGDYFTVEISEGNFFFYNPDGDYIVRDARGMTNTRWGCGDDAGSSDPTLFDYFDLSYVNWRGPSLSLRTFTVDSSGTFTGREVLVSPMLASDRGIDSESALLRDNAGRIYAFSQEQYDYYADGEGVAPNSDIVLALVDADNRVSRRIVGANVDANARLLTSGAVGGRLVAVVDAWNDVDTSLVWFGGPSVWLPVGTSPAVRTITFTITGTVDVASGPPYTVRAPSRIIGAVLDLPTYEGPGSTYPQESVVFRVMRGSTALVYGVLRTPPPYVYHLPLDVLHPQLAAGDDIYLDVPYNGAPSGPANARVTLYVQDA